MKTIPQPPPTRVESIVDVVHGQEIEDPYRWLEDTETPDTIAWVAAQNAHTRSLLAQVPGQDGIRRRLEELLSIGLVSAPAVRDGRFFYLRREGRQNQPVLYLREGLEGPERALLDPNRDSGEGTVALDWWQPSRNGKLLAYGYSANGDEWSTLHVLEVDSGRLLPDRIERARYATVAWLPDNSGFYYTRYPHAGEVPEGEDNYHERIFFHRLGTDPASDQRVDVAPLEKEFLVGVGTSFDGRYLIAQIAPDFYRTDIYVRDLQGDGGFVPVAVGYDAIFSAVDILDDVLYLHTNLDAPRFRLFRVPLETPARERWEEIIPEAPDAVLQSVNPVGGRLVGDYLRNATSTLRLFLPDGTFQSDVLLPTLGSVTAVTGEWDDTDLFYGFESFTIPPTVYRLSLESGESAVWAAVEAPVQADHYTVTQEWYPSRDGTPISMFIVHRKDLDLSRPHPTLLTGYGGFNISHTPLFVRAAYLWLEHDTVYAVPNLRGGGEYGEEWHRAGMLERKQNVFDDFIAAAEYLIDHGYTDTDQLAIQGGSNGGLLVGAALTQRPDLFRAVVCQVPLLDMLRYHQFLIARLWIPEYGSAENPEHFPFIHAYSPYHQVKPGTHYPAVLITTAESDTRVDPLHARKMTALLQASNASDNPILLRVETRAGHGVGKPLAKVIEEQTDVWSFLLWQLDVPAGNW